MSRTQRRRVLTVKRLRRATIRAVRMFPCGGVPGRSGTGRAVSLEAVQHSAATDGAKVNRWTCAPWTGDADPGIVGASRDPVAVNFGGAAVTVNGVAFQADA